MKYYHGGVPGLRVGDEVLPPSVTGHKCASDYGAAFVHRRDRVYVTTIFEAAAIFAAMHPSGRGVIYEVEPIGPIEEDPDCTQVGIGFQCERAAVKSVHPLKRKKAAKIRAALFPALAVNR